MNTEEFDFTDAQMLRRIALKRLEERSSEVVNTPQEIDEKKLLHELQVHQIELEMQNEELHKAYETAEMALKKYTMLYDLSPMGYFSLGADGTILDLNFAGADLLNERRFSLINSNFKLFIMQENLPVFNTFMQRVFTSHIKESCRVTLGYEGKNLCEVYMEGVVVDNDQQCMLSVVNISGFSK